MILKENFYYQSRSPMKFFESSDKRFSHHLNKCNLITVTYILKRKLYRNEQKNKLQLLFAGFMKENRAAKNEYTINKIR